MSSPDVDYFKVLVGLCALLAVFYLRTISSNIARQHDWRVLSHDSTQIVFVDGRTAAICIAKSPAGSTWQIGGSIEYPVCTDGLPHKTLAERAQASPTQ